MTEPEGGTPGGGAPFGLIDVAGPSMVPTLREGDQLLVRYGARIRPGAVVVFRHPFQQDLLVVKRAAERRAKGWWLLSDNRPVDSDSRSYGAVPDELVLGRVLLRLRPRPAWLAPGRGLERLLLSGPLARVPGLARRCGVWVDPDRP
ncbi:nickel-type superoxide dismutase maturation protease [Kitasatospora sp. A2-31]|uniref:nickel-type superoxide dismutase maturation protease n=1 Tax=Kitasatospora sp. A2-31 TaxID=2916414 RepID=UPI001EEC82E8|nr:nickel-type superoxide dismutase maturation protease [Kitasatospora sp. A2-31]MCG6498690.1 nickel-type superoxide dismutase maturation protease [Kitasatospora sp. A2-31]